MKGWSAVFVAAAMIAAPAVAPAQSPAPDLNSAARELARRTAALAGKGEAVAVAWRDVSSLGSAGLSQARGVFEAGLRQSGVRLSEVVPAVEAQITLSENQTQFLLVEEARKGDERQVWMAGWARTGPAAPAGDVMLQTRLLWEQPEPILDLATNGNAMLLLSGTGLMLLERSGDEWQVRRSTPIAAAKPWPRDLRGRLRWIGGNVQANLPGVLCTGTPDAVQCRPSDEPWTLDSGKALLLATFATGRNYFDGRVVMQSGTRKTLPPFYSAAAAEDGGQAVWLLAAVDGSTQMFDGALDPMGAAGAWGSDIAGTDVRCGGRTVVLATRPGDGREPDAIRPYSVVNRAAAAMGAPAEFAGPVTALWPAPGGALAIAKSAAGPYQAYSVTVSCGQ